MKHALIFHTVFFLIHSIAFAGVSDNGRSSKINVPDKWGHEVHALVMRVACIGIDGAPILNDDALASICCKDGLLVGADDQCKTSIITNLSDSTTMAISGIKLANQALATVQNMIGVSTDFNRDAKLSTSAAAAGVGAAAVADVNQSKVGVGPGAGSSSKQKLDRGNSNLNGNSRLDNGSAGAGSGGSGLRAEGQASGMKVALIDKENGLSLSGKGGGSGSGGLGGGGSGSASGSGSGSGSSDSIQDYQLGEGEDVNGDASDHDSMGSAEDPKDYFSRTNPSDSIFRIVSSRYMKKKSLWKASEKAPEVLKQNKI